MQNDNNNTQKRNLLIIGLFLAIAVISVIVFFLTRRISNQSSTSKTAERVITTAVASDESWNVQFPATKNGSLFVDIDTTTDPTVFTVPSTGSEVEQKFIIVRGLSQTENLCTLPFAASAIYRHKDENPGIDYSTAFNLNTVEIQKVKVGDWWYSTSSIITDGECFPNGSATSQDYLSLAKKYFTDFSQMKPIDN